MPSTTSASQAVTPVRIVAMAAHEAETAFPQVSGLPADCRVFVVVSLAGQPLLVTNTKAEALRLIDGNQRVVLATLH